jgi:hypothetical protein
VGVWVCGCVYVKAKIVCVSLSIEILLVKLLTHTPNTHTHTHTHTQDAALWVVQHLAKASATLTHTHPPTPTPTHTHTHTTPLFDHLLAGLLRGCYLKRVKGKIGAVKGVEALCVAMGGRWARAHVLEVVKDFFFVLKVCMSVCVCVGGWVCG